VRPNNTIIITGNPIICDCLVNEIKLALENKLANFIGKWKIKIHVDGLQCGPKSPSNLVGQLVENVPMKSLVCYFPSEMTPQACPRKCSCFLNRFEEKVVVNCSGRNLAKFPSPLPLVPYESKTIQLHMENNDIVDLEYAVQDVWNETSNYKKVNGLFLSHNKIKHFKHVFLPKALNQLTIDYNKITMFNKNDINYLF
jgi:hypothetical protein